MLCLNSLTRGQCPLGPPLLLKRPKSTFRNGRGKFCSIVPDSNSCHFTFEFPGYLTVPFPVFPESGAEEVPAEKQEEKKEEEKKKEASPTFESRSV